MPVSGGRCARNGYQSAAMLSANVWRLLKMSDSRIVAKLRAFLACEEIHNDFGKTNPLRWKFLAELNYLCSKGVEHEVDARDRPDRGRVISLFDSE